MACESGMPRSVRMVGNMKRMPLDDQKKQNDTIHSRNVVRRRSGERSSNTVTPRLTATSGCGVVSIVPHAGMAERLALDHFHGPLGFAKFSTADEIAHRFRHVTPHEQEQQRRRHTDREQRAPAEPGNED